MPMISIANEETNLFNFCDNFGNGLLNFFQKNIFLSITKHLAFMPKEMGYNFSKIKKNNFRTLT